MSSTYSPVTLGKSPVATVYSASLPASGAFGATTGISSSNYGYVTANLWYVSGSSNGAMKFYIQTSTDGGINWFDKTVKDVPVSGSTGFFESNIDTDVTKIPAQGSCKKSFTFSVFGANLTRLQIAEFGKDGSGWKNRLRVHRSEEKQYIPR